ncbi:MAG: fibronectin type III domain-containing protein [Patescibacteria group bacterium]
MKKLIQKFILSGITMVALLGFTSSVLAVDPMTVIFENNPLFGEVNFLPGDTTEGDVAVTNNTNTLQNVYAESVNGFDPDDLGNQLYLKVFENSNIVYQNEFDDFLSAGPVSLSSIDGTQLTTYTFEVSFINSTDNDYQGKSLGFDLCIGFSGGSLQCGNTVVGGENDTGGGPSTGSGSSSGGGNSGSIPLTIFNEQASDLFPFTTATITWDTNKLATSQVVYGLASGGPYTLDLNAIYFGYPSGTTEDPIKVLHHSMLITGLTPGQTYVYRVVSRASPPTISFERYFTAPLLAQANNQVNNPSSVLGASTGGSDGYVSGSVLGETASASEEIPSSNPNLAVVFASGFFDDLLSICALIALLMLLFIYLIWRLWLRKKYEQSGMLEGEILNRFYLFFGSFSLLAILVSAILGEYCPLSVLIVAFIISFCLYLYGKFKKQ